MDKLKKLFAINKLKLNIEKTKILPYINYSILKDIKIENMKIVNNYIFLGIYVDSKMTYTKYINYLSNKLSTIIYIYTIIIIYFLDTNKFILLYNSFFFI